MTIHELNESFADESELLEIEQLIGASVPFEQTGQLGEDHHATLRKAVSKSIREELDLIDDNRWLFWLCLSTIFLLTSATISYFLVRDSNRMLYERIEQRPLSSGALAMLRYVEETSGVDSADWLESRIRADRRNRFFNYSLGNIR